MTLQALPLAGKEELTAPWAPLRMDASGSVRMNSMGNRLGIALQTTDLQTPSGILTDSTGHGAGWGIEAFSTTSLPTSRRGWLPDMDLNHDKQIQSLLCYRYTIGQSIGRPR